MPSSGNDPFTIKHRDPTDAKIDAVGEGKQPLPLRGGEGADILGPRNLDRERQAPDMVRPPSTDHGTMPNMKWSFADSHTRIEVGFFFLEKNWVDICSLVHLGGWMGAADDC